MSESSKDELIDAQKQVIGMLFEVIKRLQANNNLDEEYFEIVRRGGNTKEDKKRLDEIIEERNENAKTVGSILDQLEV